jgi:hypothetical protein
MVGPSDTLVDPHTPYDPYAPERLVARRILSVAVQINADLRVDLSLGNQDEGKIKKEKNKTIYLLSLK